MRTLAASLSVALLCSSAPHGAWAQFAKAAAPVRPPVVPTAPAAMALPMLSSPGLSPNIAGSPLPSATALPNVRLPVPLPRERERDGVRAHESLPSPYPLPQVRARNTLAEPSLSVESIPKRLERLSEGASKDIEALPTTGATESRGTAETGFNRLLGAPSAHVPAGASAVLDAPAPRRLFRGGLKPAAVNPASESSSAPAAPTPATPSKSSVRSYVLGTAAMKIGIEALGLAVPLIALTVFGQAKWAAVMAMGWGLSQIIGSSIGGGILDRSSPTKVLSRTMMLQAGTVGTLLALFIAQSLTGIAFAQPIAVFALHVVTGVLAGVADTARQVIPPAVVGPEGQDLKVFNSKVHVAYEIAGVTGALLTGLAIKAFGLVPALLIHPPMLLLAAWLFTRLKLAPAVAHHAPAAAGSVFGRVKDGAGRAWADLKAGAAAVKGSRVVFWAAIALVIPLLLHRLLESLLIPIAAKVVLADPSVAAWIIAASNFGELLGAFWLMRANRDETKPSKLRSPFWIRLMSVGILGLWTFSLTPNLWFILPAVAFGSLSWAASDLSLRSKIQESLPAELRGRTFGFLTAAAFALVLLVSATLGFAFDAFSAGPTFWAVNAVLTLVVGGLLFAASRLAKTYPKDPAR